MTHKYFSNWMDLKIGHGRALIALLRKDIYNFYSDMFKSYGIFAFCGFIVALTLLR